MMFMVGTVWVVVFFVLALIFLIGGVCWIVWKIGDQDGKPIGGSIVVFFGLIFVYLWIFAAVHFNVGINDRALVVNTINQTIIGVKEHGVQRKPFIGASVKHWPANTQYQIPVTMKGGSQSATTKNGTSVYDDVVIYVDLSQMDVAAAYKAVNGDWNIFLEKNLLPGLLSISRNVSQQFYTNDHTTLRNQWEQEFEKEVKEYLADPAKGFGIGLLESRTVLSWDFVNSEDAKAFDDANRAAYQVTQKENEKNALLIEAQMVDIRNNMLSKTADGTIVNLQKMSEYLKTQPVEIRPYLMEYLNSMADMEYLRIVGQEKPDIIIPPNGSVIASVNGSSKDQTVTVPTEKK